MAKPKYLTAFRLGRQVWLSTRPMADFIPVLELFEDARPAETKGYREDTFQEVEERPEVSLSLVDAARVTWRVTEPEPEPEPLTGTGATPPLGTLSTDPDAAAGEPPPGGVDDEVAF